MSAAVGEVIAVLGLALALLLVSLLMCFVSFWIVQKSESIHLDLSARDFSAAVRELTNSLFGWVVLALLVHAASLLFLAAVLPAIWALS